jgi:hypothetical protein
MSIQAEVKATAQRKHVHDRQLLMLMSLSAFVCRLVVCVWCYAYIGMTMLFLLSCCVTVVVVPDLSVSAYMCCCRRCRVGCCVDIYCPVLLLCVMLCIRLTSCDVTCM